MMQCQVRWHTLKQKRSAGECTFRIWWAVFLVLCLILSDLGRMECMERLSVTPAPCAALGSVGALREPPRREQAYTTIFFSRGGAGLPVAMRPAFPLRLRGGSAGETSFAKLQSGANVTDVDVVRVLAHMLTPDSDKIRAAEEEMDEIIRKQPANCIKGLLVCMLCEGTAMELRQLAAVLLRRRINDMWAKLSDEQQNDVQLRLGDALVENLASTSVKLRRLLALCVSSVAALSSTAVQLDSVVERILSAANSTAASPTSAAVAISILEMLMESIAHDMHRHIPQVHEATLAALQHTHADVRTSSVKLASTLLVHALGRNNAGFSGELMQRLHSMLARAVVECDSATADCIFQSLTEVVPFVWDLEACTRTQHMLTLALNVTAQAAMPLKVRVANSN